MTFRQNRAVVGTIVLVAMCWVLAMFLFSRHSLVGFQAPPASRFSAEQAFTFTREFVTRHPRRVLGSLEARQSTGYLSQKLREMGYQVTFSHFDAVLAGRTQTGRNVLALREGGSRELVAVVAHYDTAGTTVQGAMDNGSGVGVMLELARIFSMEDTRRGFLFVASDGEEWGMLGALDLARNFSDRSRIVATLSLDHVSIGELVEMRLDTVGQFRGYTPPWLRRICREAIQSYGLHASEPAGFWEHLERALLLSASDQGPFLYSGIPAVNLGSLSKNAARAREVYHSGEDLIENLQVTSFEVYGRVAESILRNLDALEPIPSGSADDFRIRDDLYLPPSVMTLLHYLTFVPVFLVLGFHWANGRSRVDGARIWREVSGYAGVFLPMGLAYAAVPVFSSLRMLPSYSLYPATPKDPVLMHPRWGVVAGIIAVAVVAALAFYFLRKLLLDKRPAPDFQASKIVLLALLLVVALLSLQYNSYWAVTFIGLPAWIWSLVGPGRGAGGRVANAICILAAGVTFYFVTAYLASRLGVGWKIFWFEILAAGSGMFAHEGVLLALAAVSLGIRFLAIQTYAGES